jgi:hypothetical protein
MEKVFSCPPTIHPLGWVLVHSVSNGYIYIYIWKQSWRKVLDSELKKSSLSVVVYYYIKVWALELAHGGPKYFN